MRWSFWLEIKLSAIKENLARLKEITGPDVNFLPVVKSEAYGHGLLPIARTLASEGIYGFGISDLDEALRLREAGFALPILLLSGFEPAWLPEMFRLRVIPAIIDLYQLELLANFTRKKGKTFSFHLKIDTGMGRFGILPHEIEKAVELIAKNPQLRLEGVMSHFSCAEEPNCDLTLKQMKTFRECLTKLAQMGIKPRFCHIANSAALMLSKDTHYNLVRPGIALYGAYPFPQEKTNIKLKPAMTAKARILSVKEIKKGSAIGYGPLFIAPKKMKIALVPVGYDDGYLRSLSNVGFGWINGQRVPLVGAISMRAIAFDVTGLSVSPGDEIILLGGQKREVPAEELAAKGKTIPYELFCLLGRCSLKIYLE